MTNINRYVPCLLATVIALPIHAQDVRVLEEVIVTAQKMSESVQKVPISVAVIMGERLEALNLQHFDETVQLTPGVTVNSGLQSAAIQLRGVGPRDFAIGEPQSVSVFIDQVPQSQVGAVFATLVDVERIELLRGPQGTLYGQNSPGGAYNITTRDPNHDGLGGYIEGSYSLYDSSDKDLLDVRAAINIPLIDNVLAWRLAAVQSNTDGFVSMVNPLSPEDQTSGREHTALRSKMLWNINERTRLKWTVNHQDLSDFRDAFNFHGLVPGTGGANAFPATTKSFKDRRNYGEFRGQVDADLLDTTLHLTRDFDYGTLDVIAFHQQFDTESDENREPFPGGDEVFRIGVDSEISNLEIRYSGQNKHFDYVAGLYFSDQPADSDINVQVGAISVTGGAQGDNETEAVYSNFNFHLSESWDLSLGLRYDRNESALDSTIEVAGRFTAVLDDKLTFNNLSWSSKLRWYISDDVTAYLAIDNAYKQGGFNSLVSAATRLANIPGFELAGMVGEQVIAYDEEDSTAFELGIKGNAFSNKLSYSVAVFLQQFDDLQTKHSGPDALGPLSGVFSSITGNAEEAQTQGVEFELNYLVGEHWDVGVRGAYFDATAKEWTERFCRDGETNDPTQVFCPFSGDNPLHDLPQWNLNTQIGYENKLDNGWELYSRANWTWRSKANFTSATDEFDEAKSTIDLSAGMRSTELGLDVRLWAKNISNEDLNINPGLEPNGDPTQADAFVGSHHRPREYGLTLRYSF